MNSATCAAISAGTRTRGKRVGLLDLSKSGVRKLRPMHKKRCKAGVDGNESLFSLR